MNSCELVTFVSTLACQIAASHSPEETALIAAVLVQLSDSLETILAHQTLCPKENTCSNSHFTSL